jgi:hypothetical protein
MVFMQLPGLVDFVKEILDIIASSAAQTVVRAQGSVSG